MTKNEKIIIALFTIYSLALCSLVSWIIPLIGPGFYGYGLGSQSRRINRRTFKLSSPIFIIVTALSGLFFAYIFIKPAVGWNMTAYVYIANLFCSLFFFFFGKNLEKRKRRLAILSNSTIITC